MLTKPAIVFATAIVLGTAAAALAGTEDTENRGGFVIPCSLDGVNPVYHPRIFGNPAVASEYGFVGCDQASSASGGSLRNDHPTSTWSA
jgi:hypothetical protein